MKRTIFIMTGLLLAGGLTGCNRHKAAVEKPLTAVRTVAAELATVSNEVRYSGVVAPDTQVDLAFRVAGYVEQIGATRDATGRVRELQEGDFVAAGTVLARLRPAEYQTKVNYAQAAAADATAALAALQAQLAEAEASLAQATKDFDRGASLFNEKALTKADFDAVEARREASSARRQAILAQIMSQKARIQGAGAQQQEASISLGDTSLTAPFPGVVISKRIARGSLVGAGSPAFVIADTRVAKVSFGVPDSALPNFKPGEAFPVKVEAMPDRDFTGRVSSIAPSADPASRVFAVDLSIPNAAQSLRVGMLATVVVAGVNSAVDPQPSIPLAAVVKGQAGGPGGYGVYTIDTRDGADHVRLQPISLGAVKGSAVMVTSGLQPGQRVVSTAGLQLADGERIKQIP
ncbi:MAG: efflux RND transporter periplasmic adaptor subunit [Bryobacteraceae bacterium]